MTAPQPDAARETAVVPLDGGEAQAETPTMGAIIKRSLGSPVETKRVALDWMKLSTTEVNKAILAAVDACLELAGIPGAVTLADLEGNPTTFLEQLPEWVRERSIDLTNYSLAHTSGRNGKRNTQSWEKFWAVALGSQVVGELLRFNLLELLENWVLPMQAHCMRQLRHVATVAALAISQALGQHHRDLTKQRNLSKRQLEVSGEKLSQAALLDQEIDLLEERIRVIDTHRVKLLETTLPHRNRDVCEIIRLHSLVEIDKLMKQDPALFLQNKWTARVFLMIHDQSPDVRLKAIACINSWFERLKFFNDEVKDHLFQFAERCLAHIIDRSRDTESKVACKAIQMLRLPPLAERMTDEEVERIVNIVSKGADFEVRQEAALFVNAQVFQDPGIVAPEPKRRKKKTVAASRKDDDDFIDDTEIGENEDDLDRDDSVAMILNSETSISMFIEYLENYMGQDLRITDRAVGAFWNKAPCLSYWSTMVSLMILGEANRSAGLDPVSTRQRTILLFVMEAGVRRATEDVRQLQGTREKDAAIAKMDSACTSIVPELPRIFELCRSEDQQMLILSHICKLLLDHAESKRIADLFTNARPLIKALQQSILNSRVLDVVKHCTDALLKIAGLNGEAKEAFLEIARSIHSGATNLAERALQNNATDTEKSELIEDLRFCLGSFLILNQRGIDMSFSRSECLDLLYKLLDMRLEGVKNWRDKETAEDASTLLPAIMPDTGHTIYLVANLSISMVWHFRFCHWEHVAPGSTEVKDLEGILDGKQIREMFKMCPKLFLKLRNMLCDLMEKDGSPHVKFKAFSSYMMTMQVALGVSEKMDLNAQDKDQEPESGRFAPPQSRPEHLSVLWEYLNQLLVDVGTSHTIEFNDEGQRVQPHDMWPPLATAGHSTSLGIMFQELAEERTETLRTNSFKEEDTDKAAPSQQLLRAVCACRMVLESEIEDLYAGPLASLVLSQLDRAKPRPLRDTARRLLTRLRDQARIGVEFAQRYFEVQKVTIIGLYEAVGIEAALSLSLEFARSWGPRLMPWLEEAAYDTLESVVDESASRGEQGLPLLEAFSLWLKGDEFVNETRRKTLKDRAQQAFSEIGIDVTSEGAKGLKKFIQRCEYSSLAPQPLPAVEDEEKEQADAAENLELVPTPIGNPLGRRIRGKQSVSKRPIEDVEDVEEDDPPAASDATSIKGLYSSGLKKQRQVFQTLD